MSLDIVNIFTNLVFNKDVFKVKAKTAKQTCIVTYPNASKVVVVEIPGSSNSPVKLGPGDSVKIEHRFVVNEAVNITDNDFFPIELIYHGQKYSLKATKNKKLLLTR